ncbi:MAG: glycosyltransferase family 39 protein, partial [Gaiellaceae bacterium]
MAVLAPTAPALAGPRSLPRLAYPPVLAAMAALAVALTATSGLYGYHRDELYFRMLHPAWGYFDEPPLTPLLARAFNAISDEVWAMRVPATLATVASLFVLVGITRELGGGRRAQTLCAWGYASAAIPLIMGHVLLTSTVDLPVWPAILLFAIRAQLRRQPRWWLAAGVAVGISTYNKLLVAVLLVALAAGVLLVGPRRLLWSRWVLVGAGLALLLAAPNLAYQASHGWPQLSMGRALAADN